MWVTSASMRGGGSGTDDSLLALIKKHAPSCWSVGSLRSMFLLRYEPGRTYDGEHRMVDLVSSQVKSHVPMLQTSYPEDEVLVSGVLSALAWHVCEPCLRCIGAV
jgi:hypothetical protein